MYEPFNFSSQRLIGGYEPQVQFPTPGLFKDLLLERLHAAPMSTTAAFAELLRRIELNPDRVKEASQHYWTVKDWIESTLPGSLVKQVGSFQRHSKIRPASLSRLQLFLAGHEDYTPIDMDALVCVGNATTWAPPYQGIMPSDILGLVRRALDSHGTYKMKAEIDSPTVTLSYANEFKIELIPCFRDWTSLEAKLLSPPRYLVASEFGGWKLADYEYDAQYITSINQSLNGRLIPGIKIVKAFIRNYGLPIKSFHVEIICATMVTELLQSLEQAQLSWDYRHFFVTFLMVLPVVLRQPLALPGSFSPPQQIAPENAERLLYALKTCTDLCLKLCALPDSQDSLDAWRVLIGYPFPS